MLIYSPTLRAYFPPFALIKAAGVLVCVSHSVAQLTPFSPHNFIHVAPFKIKKSHCALTDRIKIRRTNLSRFKIKFFKTSIQSSSILDALESVSEHQFKYCQFSVGFQSGP